MTRLPIIVAAAIFLVCFSVDAQQAKPDMTIQSLDTNNPAGLWYEGQTRVAHGTNGVYINYNGTVLTADVPSYAA